MLRAAWAPPLRQRGFTLSELLLALGVLALLASAALPPLAEALHRARRLEAIAALYAVQLAQERHRGSAGAYTPDLSLLGWPEGLSPSGAYRLEVPHASQTGYLLVARVRPGGSQSGDARCGVLALQVEGGVSARGSACTGCEPAQPLVDTPRCWSER